MSWDIYGEPLRRGHCEVHPHVHEEYPCSVCIADNRSNEQQSICKGGCESERLLGLAREHIEHLEQEKRDTLTNLTRLKAKWQAEALEEVAEMYGHKWQDEFTEVVVDIMRKGRGYIYPEGLTERAAELRRQAGEDA